MKLCKKSVPCQMLGPTRGILIFTKIAIKNAKTLTAYQQICVEHSKGHQLSHLLEFCYIR